MSEPDIVTCDAALRALVYWIPPEQRQHAYAFVLSELEAVYIAAGHYPPLFINVLRMRLSDAVSRS